MSGVRGTPPIRTTSQEHLLRGHPRDYDYKHGMERAPT
jgi:hypothetical protein